MRFEQITSLRYKKIATRCVTFNFLLGGNFLYLGEEQISSDGIFDSFDLVRKTFYDLFFKIRKKLFSTGH